MSRRLIATVAITLLSAGSALAEVPMVATLANPVAKEQKEVIDSVVWQCEGTTCTTRSSTSSLVSASACRAIAKHYGRVVEFTGDAGALGSDQLAKCNRGLVD